MDRYLRLKKDIADAERSYIIEGLALWEIRESRLYLAEYQSWVEFVAFAGIEERHSHLLIRAAVLCFKLAMGTDQVDQLIGTDPLDQFKTSDLSGLPATERQARELTYLKSFELQQQCWRNVLKRSQRGEKITASMIQVEALLLQPETTGQQQKRAITINKTFVSENPPVAYSIPDHNKHSGQYAGVFHALPRKLGKVIGPKGLALWIILNAHAQAPSKQRSKERNIVRVDDAVLVDEFAETRKTFQKIRQHMVDKMVIQWDGDTTYTLNDIHWVLKAYDLMEETEQPQAEPDQVIKFDSIEDVQPKQLIDCIDYIDGETLKRGENPTEEQMQLALAFALLFLVAGDSEYWKGEYATGSIKLHALKDWTKPTVANRKKDKGFFKDFRDWLKLQHRNRVNGKPIEQPEASATKDKKPLGEGFAAFKKVTGK